MKNFMRASHSVARNKKENSGLMHYIVSFSMEFRYAIPINCEIDEYDLFSRNCLFKAFLINKNMSN
jgi:hypothetical protein